MTRDRMPSDEFLLTQEFLAMMLGVTRPGVSIAMQSIQEAGAGVGDGDSQFLRPAIRRPISSVLEDRRQWAVHASVV